MVGFSACERNPAGGDVERILGGIFRRCRQENPIISKNFDSRVAKPARATRNAPRRAPLAANQHYYSSA
jgi:hypothetical protein